MKAVKIKVPVNLTTGVQVPADSVAVVGEIYINNKAAKDGKIPAQIPLLLYKNAQSLNKKPILEIEDFNPLIEGKITVADYETKDAETVAVKEILQYLKGIYGNTNVEQITI